MSKGLIWVLAILQKHLWRLPIPEFDPEERAAQTVGQGRQGRGVRRSPASLPRCAPERDDIERRLTSAASAPRMAARGPRRARPWSAPWRSCWRARVRVPQLTRLCRLPPPPIPSPSSIPLLYPHAPPTRAPTTPCIHPTIRRSYEGRACPCEGRRTSPLRKGGVQRGTPRLWQGVWGMCPQL